MPLGAALRQPSLPAALSRSIYLQHAFLRSVRPAASYGKTFHSNVRKHPNMGSFPELHESAPLIFAVFIPAGSEPSDCLQAFGDCREGLIPCPLGRFKFDAPLLAAGYLTGAF